MNRRNFFGITAAASSLMILEPKSVFGYGANSAVRLGLLGCGNRGTEVATSFAKNTTARVVALADIFPDKLAQAKTHFDEVNAGLGNPAIDTKRMYRGHSAFQQIAASSDLDAIQISTPPFFHVEHLDAVVSAGKHAYCEKPIGVDIAQTIRVLGIAKRVDGKVSIDVGFQIRSAPPFVEIVRRIHAGDIGKIASIAAHYDAPEAVSYAVTPSMSADERRLRNWLWDRTLSGDILLEQNIHVIDVCNWIMGTSPTSAVGKCSRKVVQNLGNTSDNYQVIFTYPGGVELSFSSTQFGTNGFFDVTERIFGSTGIADAPYSGPMRITGQNPWMFADDAPAQGAPGKFAADGAFTDNLRLADTMKERSFIESIASGRFHNQIADGVASARSCMLGRKAAETGQQITLDRLLQDEDIYSLDMDISQFQ
jgi:myo-inositol 2-dehydrogenase/D-chiro-inositol 1-dehydrogenase